MWPLYQFLVSDKSRSSDQGPEPIITKSTKCTICYGGFGLNQLVTQMLGVSLADIKKIT
jgi:hypothetical protein